MSNVTVFIFGKMPVRVVARDVENLFVIRDICNILGFSNPNRELSKHTENVPLYERIRTPGGLQIVRLVPLSDVERLLDANKGNIAPKLHLWLLREVVPAIRKGTSDVKGLLDGYFDFLQEIMSIPLRQQPAVAFSLTDLPFEFKLRKRGKRHDR